MVQHVQDGWVIVIDGFVLGRDGYWSRSPKLATPFLSEKSAWAALEAEDNRERISRSR